MTRNARSAAEARDRAAPAAGLRPRCSARSPSSVGVGLMARRGYPISRAAEHPPILSLMVADRRGPVLRPRPAVRCATSSGSRLTTRAARRSAAAGSLLPADRAARPRRARLLPRGRPAVADGRRRGRAPEPATCAASSRPLVALLAGAALGRRRRSPSSPRRASCSPPACSLAGWPCRRSRASSALVPVDVRPAARGELSAELVELLRGAPEIVAFGGEAAGLDRVRAADRTLVRRGPPRRVRRRAPPTASSWSSPASPSPACSRSRSTRSAPDALDRVLIAMLALLALASFEAVTPLAAAARELSATLAAGRRLLELTDAGGGRSRPGQPAPAPRLAVHCRARERARPLSGPASSRLSMASTSGSRPASAVALVGPSGAGRPPSPTCCFASSTPKQDA